MKERQGLTPSKSLSELSDLEMMMTVLSSGDYFPGFYRYTMGTQKISDETLNLSNFIFLYLEQNINGFKHHKEEWLQTQHEVYDRDVASETARNYHNFPEARKLITDGMYNWYFDETEYDVFYMKTDHKIEEVEINKTYYFMGSLIRYENGKLKIGYNDYLNEAVLSLNVSWDEFCSYLKKTFQKDWIGDLFLESEVIGCLSFDDKEMGSIGVHDERVDEYLAKAFNLRVFAVPSKSRKLPIRFAKHIRLSNFQMNESGRFQVWKR